MLWSFPIFLGRASLDCPLKVYAYACHNAKLSEIGFYGQCLNPSLCSLVTAYTFEVVLVFSAVKVFL